MASHRVDQAYPAAAQFFAGYLHQDWPEESGSWEAAAGLFIARESRAQVAAAAADVTRLLNAYATDADLVQVLDAFGNAYDPTPDGVSVRDWLRVLLDRLRSGGADGDAV